MYSGLRPEIRATQRVLRSINPASESFQPTHRTVRSFSSYIRLQAQSGNGSDQGKPGSSKDDSSTASVTDKFHNILQSLRAHNNQPSSNDVPHNFFSHPEVPVIDFNEFVRKKESESKELRDIHIALERGELPKGYRIVNNEKDVPQELRSKSLSERGLEFPFLWNGNADRVVHGYSLPKGVVNLREPKPEPEESNGATAKQEEDLEESAKSAASNTFSHNFYGSSNARRKRPRTSKAVQVLKEQTPSWLLDNNVKPTRLPGMHAEMRPGVWSTTYRESGIRFGVSKPASDMGTNSYKPTTSQQGSAEVLKSVEGEEAPESSVANSSPDSEGNNGAPVVPLNAKDEGSNVSSESSINSRYFIDSTQREEVLHTFSGRLRRSTDPVSNTYPGPSAATHLAIYHTAKDADLLLYQLVEDMCQSQGADLLRLDAQDISALIARADNDAEISSRGARASFSIFKNIYGSTTGFFDPLYPKGDDFEDHMGEDEDDANPREPVDIPVASFVALPGSGMPKGFLDGLRRKVFGSGGPLSGFLDQQSSESNSRFGMFTSTIDSLLSSTTKKIHSEYSRRPEDEAKPEEDSLSADKGLDHRPLVIHIPDIAAIQAHPLTGAFLSELLQTASMSAKTGRHIMVVGTDCLRDVDAHTTRSILDEQEGRTIESATAIILTPSFPHAETKVFLLEDRRRRIASINARHLWAVLHNGRGALLKGLEAGFWTRDLTKELGELDFSALARDYLSYSRIQRIASILSAESFKNSQSPISDAIHLIESSDETKSSYFNKRNPQNATKPETKIEEKPEEKRLAMIRSIATKHEKKLLSGVIEPSKISTTFQDIHIATETIETLQTLTTLSLLRPEAFRYGVLKSDRIPGLLLYGPPGTGKTLAAKAVAKESGATMLEVSAANLNDMYVGEGEKNVQALFSLAKKLSPCVVFLDEADAMFSARQAQGRRVSHRELLNQFLKEWDGMSNDSGSAFIMVATNRPMDLDDAVLRRLPRRILVDLPTEQDRLEILRIHLRQESLADDVNMTDLAKKTPFYSGSDLKNVAVAAALRAVREEHDAAKKHAKENPEAEAYQFPERRVLTNAHFEKALEEISASISEDMTTLKDIKKFDEQYGDKRGKRKKTPKWGFRSPADAAEKRETVKVRSE